MIFVLQWDFRRRNSRPGRRSALSSPPCRRTGPTAALALGYHPFCRVANTPLCPMFEAQKDHFAAAEQEQDPARSIKQVSIVFLCVKGSVLFLFRCGNPEFLSYS